MWNAKIMSGTGKQVAEQLGILQKRIEADGIMLLNPGHSQGAICRSMEFIADSFQTPDLEA